MHEPLKQIVVPKKTQLRRCSGPTVDCRLIAQPPAADRRCTSVSPSGTVEVEEDRVVPLWVLDWAPHGEDDGDLTELDLDALRLRDGQLAALQDHGRT